MTDIDSYEPGTPSWIDLGTPDIDASIAFYGGLFGWEAPEVDEATAAATGGYRTMTLRGKPVAGFGPQQAPGLPYWSTYVSVADADGTAGFVDAAGGATLVPPMDIMALGRMAIFADPEGSAFGVWQPREFVGAQVAGEHGALIWNELDTRNPDAAKVFYHSVFGWDADEMEGSDDGYFQWQLNGRTIGGMMPMVGDDWPGPEDLPSHWMVYFGSDDADATAARCEELGGHVQRPPSDIPTVGRFAVLSDPQGAHFSILTPAPM